MGWRAQLGRHPWKIIIKTSSMGTCPEGVQVGRRDPWAYSVGDGEAKGVKEARKRIVICRIMGLKEEN